MKAAITVTTKIRLTLAVMLLPLTALAVTPGQGTQGQAGGVHGGHASKGPSMRVAAVQDQQKALRKRAEELYVLFQLGHWDKAEAYVSPDTRENFRKQPKNSFLGFQIDSIDISLGQREGFVSLHMQVPGTAGSPGVVSMPQSSKWKLVDNTWYLVVPDPANQQQTFQALFNAPTDRPPAHPEELKFKGHRYTLGKIEPGQIKVARFPFTNITDHPVVVSSVETGCPCLQAKTEKKEFKPGESGEIAVTFNPEGFERGYMQTIVVKTKPGDLTTYLTVAGYIIPRELQGRKPEVKSKPGS